VQSAFGTTKAVRSLFERCVTLRNASVPMPQP
jgi:hypothetical protein